MLKLATALCYAALIATPFHAMGSTIPDAPVTAIEPGLEVNTTFGGVVMGWLDQQTLLVTAQIDSSGQFWERHVMLVDIPSGKTKEAIEEGSVTCVHTSTGVVGIMAGSQEKMFSGQSAKPAPKMKFFQWNRGERELVELSEDAASDIDRSLCRKIDARKKPENYRYLEVDDGYLVSDPNDGNSPRERRLLLVKENKVVTKLDVKAGRVLPVPAYLPFRKGYLLRPGAFVMRSHWVADGVQVQEFPSVIMSPTGEITQGRQYRSLFEGQGFTGEGAVFPYAKGEIIWASGRSQDGGGAYLSANGALKRIWCSNKFNTCREESWPSISPDGCHLAVFTKGSDSRTAPLTHYPTLKILPLCQ